MRAALFAVGGVIGCGGSKKQSEESTGPRAIRTRRDA